MKSVDDYQQAIRDFEAASDKLRTVVESAKYVANVFANWNSIDPRSVNGNLDRAMEIWVDRRDLQQAVESWKESFRRMNSLWEVISNNDRIGLLNPLLYKESKKS